MCAVVFFETMSLKLWLICPFKSRPIIFHHLLKPESIIKVDPVIFQPISVNWIGLCSFWVGPLTAYIWTSLALAQGPGPYFLWGTIIIIIINIICELCKFLFHLYVTFISIQFLFLYIFMIQICSSQNWISSYKVL